MKCSDWKLVWYPSPAPLFISGMGCKTPFSKIKDVYCYLFIVYQIKQTSCEVRLNHCNFKKWVRRVLSPYRLCGSCQLEKKICSLMTARCFCLLIKHYLFCRSVTFYRQGCTNLFYLCCYGCGVEPNAAQTAW